ncbi:MAG TPA: protease pro-enzyme activation domain-containing protein, partial [Terriglobales bacterium]
MTLRVPAVSKLTTSILIVFFCTLTVRSAQGQAPQTRITQPIIESQRVTLSGHVHPLARAKYDQGAVEDSAPASRMLMLLSRTEAQQSALDKLLEEQQTPGSTNYRRWLTPEEFGAKFGASDADVQKVTSWLVSKGFTVENVSASKSMIEFSGTAGQVRSAFQTELHTYALPTGTYTANNSDPQIPAALAPVVSGFVSLNNFPRRPFSQVRGGVVRTSMGAIRPEWTGSDSTGTFYAISPGDFATIYNSFPLIRSGINGAGQTIGIVGQSNISLTDVTNFRSLFGLPASTPTVVVSGADPGLVTSGDEGESVMDVEWAGATAPGATIKLVIAKTTSTTSGVDLAAQDLVNNNRADILSESYGACESQLGTSGNSFYKNLWQQAASQGITVVIATGDNGSAGCEDPNKYSVSDSTNGGVGVSGIASTPYNVAVGGTDFNNASSLPTYWSSSNFTDSTTGEKHISALGYIPEMTWNDSCAHSATSTSLTPCATVTSTDSTVYGTLQLWAGSGGPSNCATSTTSGCTAGYAKPSWQTGTGVPSDGVRDLPDVSLFAATGESGSNSFYVACQADNKSANCVPATNGSVTFLGVSGTSASAPNFAAIVALAGQQVGNQRLGNVNYLLYKIAAQTGSSCASSGAPLSSCVFYDAQVGNISVPCNPGSPNCSVSSGTAKGVLVANGAPAYMTTSGYDTATGLGSVNVTNLVAAIAGIAIPTISTPTANPAAVKQNTSTTLSVTVTGNSSLGAPAGSIKFYDGGSLIGTATKSSAGSNAISGTLSYTPATAGTHTITASYIGDGTYTSYVGATSSALSLNVTSLATATISAPSATSTSFTLGNTTTLTVTVTGDSS